MEQRAKLFWDEHHYGDPNPYADLPRMQILTFTLPKMLRDQAIENNEVFKFHEFFRVYTEEDKLQLQKLIDNEPNVIKKAEYQAELAKVKIDKFVHEKAINRFLDKLVEESDTSLYPFSSDVFREHFRHTFWLLPGVKEAAALEQLCVSMIYLAKKTECSISSMLQVMVISKIRMVVLWLMYWTTSVATPRKHNQEELYHHPLLW